MRALFDLEPRAEEPDYELAFRSVEGGKRSLVLVFCDLLEETAARPLVDAVPVLARRHAVVVASVRDPDLDERARDARRPTPTRSARRPWRSTCSARARASAHMLRRAGAQVVEAPADQLAAACVAAYLRAKARGARVDRATARSAQYAPAASTPTASGGGAAAAARGVTKPSIRPASTSHGIVPEHDLHRRCAPRAAATRRA